MTSQQVELRIRQEIERLYSNEAELTARIQAAVHQAVREHLEAGNYVVGWKNGEMTILRPGDAYLPKIDSEDERL